MLILESSGLQGAYLYLKELHRAVSFEWQHGLYFNFIDFPKAFDSAHTESLWSILRIYMGIPKYIVRVIKQIFYTDLLG